MLLMKYLCSLFLTFSLLLCCEGCDQLFLGEEGGLVSLEENLAPPPLMDDGLQVGRLEEVAIDPAILELVKSFHEGGAVNQRSMLVARHNKLVLEAYFKGWNRERRQDMRSAAKSVTSALVGIAIDQGYIAGVEEPVYSFFPEYESFNYWEPEKEQMTIGHFLRMQTGLDCSDRAGTSPASRDRMYDYHDWVKVVLDAKVRGTPGEGFIYCSGAPVVLGAVVSNASGLSIPDFAEKYLLGPLGITHYAWEYMPSGRADTGGHLHLRPRDMLKFGLLFLNQGEWNGRQLVSGEWVEESTRAHGPAEEFEYGYLWWNKTWAVGGREIPSYFARGNGGQLIFVFPTLDTVIVFTAGEYNSGWVSRMVNTMQNRVLPYIR